MAQSPIEVEVYDAWILAALICSTERTIHLPLWQVIARADATNKDIILRGELEVALDRLSRAGYLRVVPGGFEATPKALALKDPKLPLTHIAQAIGARPCSKDRSLPKTPRIDTSPRMRMKRR